MSHSALDDFYATTRAQISLPELRQRHPEIGSRLRVSVRRVHRNGLGARAGGRCRRRHSQ